MTTQITTQTYSTDLIDEITVHGRAYERLTQRGPRGGRTLAYRTGPGADYWHPTCAQALRRSGERPIHASLWHAV